MANISQRITLEGGDDIRAKLQELARVAAAAFREIESAAGKVKVDPAAAKSFEELSSVTSKLAEEFNKLGDGASTTAPAIEKTGIAAGAAPPSKFHARPVPLPLPENVAVCGTSSTVGALEMVPFGITRPTLT